MEISRNSAYKLKTNLFKREGDYLRFDEFEAPSYAVSAENSDIEFLNIMILSIVILRLYWY